MRLKLSWLFIFVYVVGLSVPFVFNLQLYIISNEVSDLFTLDPVNAGFIVLAFTSLIAAVKLKLGSGLYELPLIAQTLGNKEISLSTMNYLSNLAGKEGSSGVDEIVTSLSKFDYIKPGELKLRHLRTLEDCAVSRSFNLYRRAAKPS